MMARAAELAQARLRHGPTRHARRLFPAHASRVHPTRRSLVPSRRKTLPETRLNREDRLGSRRSWRYRRRLTRFPRARAGPTPVTAPRARASSCPDSGPHRSRFGCRDRAPALRRRFARRPQSMSGHVSEHLPVMLEEVVEALAPRSGGHYVDCTFGRGGHARALLDRIGPAGRILAIDRDPQAVAAARELAGSDPRVSVRHARFGDIGTVVDAADLRGCIDAVLMDLGVSSPQIDQPERGFSFLSDGPLDMRMDRTTGESAAEMASRAPSVRAGDRTWCCAAR